MENRNIISKVKEHWESAYRDCNYKELPWETVDPDEEIVRPVKEKKIPLGKVLDLGCGSGTNSIFLAKSGADVTGIGVSESAIKTVNERAAKENVKCNFIVGDAYEFNFPKESFDFVLDGGAFTMLRHRFTRSM